METLPQLLETALGQSEKEPAWLQARRRAALDALAERGLPTLADEDWKYTNLAEVVNLPFRLAGRADCEMLDAPALAALAPASTSAHRIVFVNGHLREDLSNMQQLPRGISARSLASVLAAQPDVLGATLDSADGPAFSALNTAALADGVLLEVAANTVLDDALSLVFVGAGEQPLLRTPRVVIRLAAHARLRVVEQYLSTEGDHGLTNVVTNVELGEGAELFHHRLQNEAETSAHIGRLVAEVGANAVLHSDSVAFGGHLTRIDIDVALAARGARCVLNGLFAGHGRQHIDHHTRIDHLVGDTHSEERYRGILDDRARGVFNGKVVVHKDAQKISAKQASNNLLLSRQAEIDTKPELEIYADDVTCAHGATVGELDPAALFYLRSRGIPQDKARALLIYAFAEQVIEAIPLESLRDAIEQRFIGHQKMSEMLDEMLL